jgi:hypothetical protein
MSADGDTAAIRTGSTGAMVIRTYQGWLGSIVKADVQLPSGVMINMVPVGDLLKV